MHRISKPIQTDMQPYTVENPTETTPIVLSPEQRARLAARSSKGIVQVLVAQAFLAVVVVLASWWLGGMYAAASALIGAGVYFLPNSIFALRLLIGLISGTNATAMSFFWGEAFKLGSALALFGLAVWQFNQWLVWPALLAGLIGVLKGYVVLLALGRLP